MLASEQGKATRAARKERKKAEAASESATAAASLRLFASPAPKPAGPSSPVTRAAPQADAEVERCSPSGLDLLAMVIG